MGNPFFQVIFRTCDIVNAVNNTPRPFNLDKKTLSKICFKSLYDSLQGLPHNIVVIGDKLSNEMGAFFGQYPVDIIHGDYGNDESIRQSIKKAVEFPDDYWIYLCEDDYLHRPESFRYVNNFIQKKHQIIPEGKKKFFTKTNHSLSKSDISFFLSDYPDRYWPNDREPFYIFYSDDCHWWQVANITFTFLLQAKVIKKYKKTFDASSVGARDGYLSDMLFRLKNYGKENICICPLPGLSSHMHVGTMTPLVDWESIIEKYRNEI